MKRLSLFLLSLVLLWACKEEEEEPMEPQKPTSPVVFDLNEVPYPNLSDYNFFDGNMVDHEPVYGVIPYDVVTPLFADYAHKFRFIWMPDGAQASYDGDHNILSFQDGTVLIKTFYFDNVQNMQLEGNRYVIETRIEFMRNGLWEFAEYVWNADQTDAEYDMGGRIVQDIEYISDEGELRTVDWRIPAEPECLTCHKVNESPIPIGPKPQNINKDYAYEDGVRNQLLKLIEMGYLEPDIPSQIETVVPWDDPSFSLEERARAYLDMNCAHCHADNTHCDYRPIRFAWNETVDPVNLGVCVEPTMEGLPGQTHLITAGNAGRSSVYLRMNTNEVNQMMPIIGRSVIHQEGVDLIRDYINSLEEPCE